MKRTIIFPLGVLILIVLLSFTTSRIFNKPNLKNSKANEKVSSQILISNINLIDVISGEIVKNQDILIEHDRILKILNTRKEISLPNYTQIIDGTDKFILPGLWDMHTHPDDPEVWRMKPTTEEKDLILPLFVINGITGIRDMGGDLNLVKRWRRLSKSDLLIAPTIIAGGPLLDGPNPMWDGSVGIDGPENVKHVVDSLINEGVDFLKVYSLLPRETYLALSDYANKLSFPFVGHVPFTVPPSEAALTGMKSQEHLLEILKECSDQPTDSLNNLIKSLDNGIDRYIAINNFRLNNFNLQKADSLYSLFKEHNIWHCPTLSMWYKNAWYEEELKKDKELIKYLPRYIQAYWTPEINDHLNHRDNIEFIEIKKRLYKKYLSIVNDMNEKGIKLLAGTDMGANPLCFPGTGLHNELKAFVEAGLTPIEAIQTSTINPALFLNIEKDYGNISKGKKADLLILEKNPLTDINNITSTSYVIKNGKVFNVKDIQKIKDNIVESVTQPSKE